MQPFTYLLIHKATGRRYYGVRCCKMACPSQLWNSYFSSSKIVKDIIRDEGGAAFQAEIRQTFDSKEAALKWEERFLVKVGAAKSKEWLNRSNGGKQFSCTLHTKETKAAISKALSGRPKSEEHRKKIASTATWVGKVTTEQRSAAQRGRVHDRESVERMRAAKRGKKRVYREDGSFYMA